MSLLSCTFNARASDFCHEAPSPLDVEFGVPAAAYRRCEAQIQRGVCPCWVDWNVSRAWMGTGVGLLKPGTTIYETAIAQETTTPIHYLRMERYPRPPFLVYLRVRRLDLSRIATRGILARECGCTPALLAAFADTLLFVRVTGRTEHGRGRHLPRLRIGTREVARALEAVSARRAYMLVVKLTPSRRCLLTAGVAQVRVQCDAGKYGY